MTSFEMTEDQQALEMLKTERATLEQDGDIDRIKDVDDAIDEILDRRWPR